MNNHNDSFPPKAPLRFLSWFCPEHLHEEIEGDLIQRFNKDVKLIGEKTAKRKLILSTIRFFRPGIILRNRFSTSLIHQLMIGSYIKIAFRSFQKQKSFTALNIIGLSLAMAASILLLQYVKYEKSFDSFHSRAKDIYRIQYNVWHGGKLNFESALSVPAVGRALKDNFSEVEEFTRLYPIGGVVSYQSPDRGLVSFHEEKMPYADPAIFKVFDFQVITGDKKTSLDGPNKIMLSQRASKKYFGEEEPFGKMLKLNDESFEVTGIFEDVPENSHIKFDLLISYETMKRRFNPHYQTNWGWYDFYTYVLLKPNTDVKAFQASWDRFLAKERSENWKESKQEFILRPLLDIHLNSNLLYEAQPNEQRDGDSVYALMIVAFFIIAIAWTNYINLATARAFRRAKEVGVKKVIGAFRGQLISQFFTESVIMNVIGVVIAIALVVLAWPYFSTLSGWTIPLTVLIEKNFWFYLFGFLAIGTFLSGFYPAVVLSSFKPISVLKGKIVATTSGEWIRKSLVIFQFAASVFLICGSVIVFQQLNFMRQKDLGININKTLVLRGTGIVDSLYLQKLETFKNEALQVAGIKSITASTNIPGDEIYWTGGIKRIVGGPPDHQMVSHLGIDHDYISSYDLKLVAGKNFGLGYTNDNKRVIVNRALADQLEFNNPQEAIGQLISQQGDTLEIIGVVENYHQLSLKRPVEPLVFMLRESSIYYSLKMETANQKELLAALEKPWKNSFADAPFDYFFLDQFFNKQYEKEDRFGKVFTLFTTLSIFIALLGFLGLASFMATMRTKEIGIRKVFGSSVTAVVVLLSKGFMRPVVIANLIAWPLAWWAMDTWLQSFPYRITINMMLFPVVGITVLIIAFVFVSSQTLKAAFTSPSKTLKHE